MEHTRESSMEHITLLQRELALTQMRSQSESLHDHGITVAQLHTLLFVYAAPGRRTAEVAERVGMKPNIATGVIQRLVTRGWLERTPDAEDGRVRRLALTASGTAFVESVAGAAEQQFARHLALLSDAQLEQLADILGTIVAASHDGA